jgi:hypothetical protein
MEVHMPAVTFAAPILPGQTEAWKAAALEMAGPREREFADSRRRMGITREVVSLQETPDGDFVVVCLEADDPNGVIPAYMSSDEPFDRWFAETVLVGVHGMKRSGEGPPPNQVYVDWSA